MRAAPGRGLARQQTETGQNLQLVSKILHPSPILLPGSHPEQGAGRSLLCHSGTRADPRAATRTSNPRTFQQSGFPTRQVKHLSPSVHPLPLPLTCGSMPAPHTSLWKELTCGKQEPGWGPAAPGLGSQGLGRWMLMCRDRGVGQENAAGAQGLQPPWLSAPVLLLPGKKQHKAFMGSSLRWCSPTS